MSARPEPQVHWREGMFLCPQHLQAFAREMTARIARGDAAGRAGSWGLARLRIDEQALARDVLAIEELEAVFEDGTLACVPETAEVARRAFGELFTGAELPVWIGVSARRANVPVVDATSAAATDGDTAGGADAAGARFRVATERVQDENERESGQELEFRRLRLRAFFGDESRDGYDCLPLAKLVRRGRPEARSVLAEDFIPPLLACGAWAPLVRELEKLVETLRAEERDLAAKVPSMSALSSVDRGADLAGFLQLQAIQRSLADLEQVARAPALHPFDAWLWLVQAVGNLAAFGPERVVPRLPAYSHGELGTCFASGLRAVRELMAVEVAVPYSTSDFEKDPQREGFYSCAIPADWIAHAPIFYLGVEMDQPPEKVQSEVATKVKLAAPSDVELVLTAVPGIAMAKVAKPPLAFPKRAGLHFFRIEDDEGARVRWQTAVREKSVMLLSALGGRAGARFQLYVELRG